MVYADAWLIVEIDGNATHEGDGRIADITRDLDMATSGWLTVRIHAWAIGHHPAEVAAAIREVIEVRRAQLACGRVPLVV